MHVGDGPLVHFRSASTSFRRREFRHAHGRQHPHGYIYARRIPCDTRLGSHLPGSARAADEPLSENAMTSATCMANEEVMVESRGGGGSSILTSRQGLALARLPFVSMFCLASWSNILFRSLSGACASCLSFSCCAPGPVADSWHLRWLHFLASRVRSSVTACFL